MRNALIFVIVGMTGLLLTAGCGPRPTSLRLNYGESFAQAMKSQIVHPDAVKNQQTPEGLNGQAIQETMKRYRSNFTKPPTAQKEGGGKSIINIGTGGK